LAAAGAVRYRPGQNPGSDHGSDKVEDSHHISTTSGPLAPVRTAL